MVTIAATTVDTGILSLVALGLNVVGILWASFKFMAKLDTATRLQELKIQQQSDSFRQSLAHLEAFFTRSADSFNATMLRLEAAISHLDQRMETHGERLASLEAKAPNERGGKLN